MRGIRRAKTFFWKLLTGRDKGSVAIQFILTLPILLTIIGVIVQYALLVNAHFTLERALAAAARSAMTSLPINQNIGDAGGPDNVQRSALMTLESLSPQSKGSVSDESLTVADALRQVGLTPPDDTYAARYTYAQEATILNVQPINGTSNYDTHPSPRVRITLSYDFYLTVPGINVLIGRTDTVGGILGRFRTMTVTADVQLSPGREATSSGNGDPTAGVILP